LKEELDRLRRALEDKERDLDKTIIYKRELELRNDDISLEFKNLKESLEGRV